MNDEPITLTAVNSIDDTLFPDGLLWHFTKTECLVSILKNGIRATHSSCLSDRIDGCLRNRCQEIYSDLLAAKSRFNGDSLRVEIAKKRFNEVLGNDAAFPSFIACFASNPNFETMWERYGLNGGIAIGIREQAIFEKRIINDEERIRVKLCDYHRWQFYSENIRSNAIRIKEAIQGCSSLADIDTLCQKEIPSLHKQAEQLLFVKRHIFEFEHEVRLAVIVSGQKDETLDKYRKQLKTENGKMFFHIDFGKEPKDWVGRIVVGPYGNADNGLASTLTIARLYGIPLERVERYRPSYI